ncbi:hypothetical protein GCM10009754_43440 [Amycolatopsis minnesotensis]|uniref:ADP-ribosylglycohydrolase n=2 Tax=Amycolatopsis minnesotensis TaxID=337894 RepID=A0ABN2RAW9_9PSEU
MLAGAVGDSLGAPSESKPIKSKPIESRPIEQIRERTTPQGLVDFIPAHDGIGTITDDTRMTLFTAEALIRAHSAVRHGGTADPRRSPQLAYQRWLHTQGVPRARRHHVLRAEGVRAERAGSHSDVCASVPARWVADAWSRRGLGP